MTLGIIAGTGALDLLEQLDQRSVQTRYGLPSSMPARVSLGQADAWFIARHGNPHTIPPHRVNYRANIDTFRQIGVSGIIAVNAVGGIDADLSVGSLVLPDQLIDYTWGRAHSFSDEEGSALEHIEFAEPFAGPTRNVLIQAAADAGIALHDGGCCAVTQGPRLETAAEIRKLAADGCTLVGMTSMPEAALAREAGLDYASLSIVANPAAGVVSAPISLDEIYATLAIAMDRIKLILGEIHAD
ncbi:MAG: S-methyl-5'-thioinosine phosphorylase [Wenzhouxiangella sp.]